MVFSNFLGMNLSRQRKNQSVFLALAFATSIFLGARIAGAVSLEGLTMRLSFDEGTGAIAQDASGNGNNGAIAGATWVAGKLGSALDFDGVNDFAQVEDQNAFSPSVPFR